MNIHPAGTVLTQTLTIGDIGWVIGRMGYRMGYIGLGDGVTVRFSDYGDNGDYEDCGLLWYVLTAMERAKKKKINLRL